jgi:hypothetical protein
MLEAYLYLRPTLLHLFATCCNSWPACRPTLHGLQIIYYYCNFLEQAKKRGRGTTGPQIKTQAKLALAMESRQVLYPRVPGRHTQHGGKQQ